MSTSYKPRGPFTWFFKVWLPKGDNLPAFILLLVIVPLAVAACFALVLWSPLPFLYWLGYMVISVGVAAITGIYLLISSYVKDALYSWKEFDEAEKQRVINLLKD